MYLCLCACHGIWSGKDTEMIDYQQVEEAKASRRAAHDNADEARRRRRGMDKAVKQVLSESQEDFYRFSVSRPSLAIATRRTSFRGGGDEYGLLADDPMYSTMDSLRSLATTASADAPGVPPPPPLASYGGGWRSWDRESMKT
jgi:hypothetical protein